MKSKKTAKNAAAPQAADSSEVAETAAAKPRARKKAAAAEPPAAAPAKKAAAKRAKKHVKSEEGEAVAINLPEEELAAEPEAEERVSSAAVVVHEPAGDAPAAPETDELAEDTEEEALTDMASKEDEFTTPEDEELADEEREPYAAELDIEDSEADDSDEEESDDEDSELEDAEEEDESDEEEDAEPYEERPGNPERLQKILAKAGLASRRAAEEMILAGRVQVNGKVVTELGTKAELGRDHIRVDGKLLHGAERIRYFVLNKPKGYVTTVSDPEHRPTVMQFFAGERERLYPVGRLDYLSEGLLLVTNDGELANALTKAANGVEKTYLVKVAGTPSEEQLEQLRQGMVIERGRLGSGAGRVRTAPAQIRKVREGDNPWYEVILIEGRNREIRKLFEEIGHHVEKIRRVGYGPLVLDLEPGQLRELTDEEVHKLRLTAEGKLKPRRRRGPAPAQLERKAGRAVQHEKFGSRVPRRKQDADKPALYDRPDFSDLGAPARKPRPQFRPAERDASTGPATGRREFKPRSASAGDRDQRPPRRESADRPAARFPERSEGRPPRKSPASFDRPAKSFDRKPQDRDRGSRPERSSFAGRGREERRPPRPGRSREEAQEAAEFGVEPIERTPGFRVEEVKEAPRPSRPPRTGFPDSRGPSRSGNRPFRGEGRPPQREGRPPRPFRDRDEARGSGSRPTGPRSAGPRPTGPRRESSEGDRPTFRPRRNFQEGEERPRSPRPGGRPAGQARPAGSTRPAGAGRPGGAGRPRTGDRPFGSGRPKPFGATGQERPGSRPKREEGDAPRDKKRWRNSFDGKNKGRPKPKPKRES